MTVVTHADDKKRIRVHYDDASLTPPSRFLLWVGVGGNATVHSEANESPNETWQRVLIEIECLRKQARREAQVGEGYADIFAGVEPTLEQYQARYREWVISEHWQLARHAKEQIVRVEALGLLAAVYGLDAPLRVRTEVKVTR